MNEMDDPRRERLFDSLLDAVDHWQTTPEAQARRVEEQDADVARDLSLLPELRAVQPEREETEFARARIAWRLDELMREEPLGAEAARPPDAREWMRSRLRALTAPPAAERAAARERAQRREAARATRQARRRALARAVTGQMATLAAALLLLACAALTGASAAAARALPESPLYVVKRAEETALLAISWGDSNRGQTLNLIANHRLGEAASEADLNRSTEAHALLGQFDSVFSQLITLTQHAQAQGEDVAILTSGIQATVASEQSIGARATAHGETDFAAAVSSSAQSAMALMRAAGISAADPGNTHGHQNSGNPGQTPTPRPTHTPRANPNGVGGPNGGVTPVVTPVVSATATPVATPSATPSATSTPSRGHNGGH